MPKIVTLPGDGIGPEIIAPPLRVLEAVGADLDYEEHPFGGALDRRARHRADRRDARRLPGRRRGAARPPSAARSGTPPTRPRRGPSRGCSACARAWACSPTCARSGRCRRCTTRSPLKRELIEGTDLLVVRELTGGIYFGEQGAQRRPRLRRAASTPWRRSSGSPASAFGAAGRA